MKAVRLIQFHATMARRQRLLWFASLPLTAFATLLAIISPAAPRTGGTEDLAFTGQMIAIFTGIAYSAAFSNVFLLQARLGTDELESTSPTPMGVQRAARLLGSVIVVVAPSATVLVICGAAQSFRGAWAAIPTALAVTVSIVVPAAALSMSLSAFAGAVLRPAFGRIVAVLVWLYLVFSSPLIPIPVLNGGILNVVGDTVAAGFFRAAPIYRVTGVLGVEGTPLSASASLAWQLALVSALVAFGTYVGARLKQN